MEKSRPLRSRCERNWLTRKLTLLSLAAAGKYCPYRNIVFFCSLILNTLNLEQMTLEAVAKIAAAQAIVITIYLRVINQLEYRSYVRVLMAILLVIQLLSVNFTMELIEYGPRILRKVIDNGQE